MAAPKTIAVIDPAAGTPELDAFNALAQRSSALPVAFTYHLPALFGMGSLAQLEARAQLAGVIVFGSAASVHDDAPWQRELNAWLLPRLQSDAGPPVLGLCYGHQVIAHLLGGEVGRVWPGAPLCLPARPPAAARSQLLLLGRRDEAHGGAAGVAAGGAAAVGWGAGGAAGGLAQRGGGEAAARDAGAVQRGGGGRGADRRGGARGRVRNRPALSPEP